MAEPFNPYLEDVKKSTAGPVGTDQPMKAPASTPVLEPPVTAEEKNAYAEDAAKAAAPAAPTQDGIGTAIGKTVVGAVRNVANAIPSTGLDVGEALATGAAKIADAIVPTNENRTKARDEHTAAGFAAARKSFTFSEVTKSDYVGSDAAREVLSFVVGGFAMGSGNILKEGGKLALGTVAKGTGENLLQGFSLTDPHAQNLSNLMDSNPVFHTIIGQYMAQNPDSPDALNKLRGAIENAVVSPAVEFTFLGIKATVKYLKAVAAGDKDAAKILEAAAPKINKAVDAAQDMPVPDSIFKVEEPVAIFRQHSDPTISQLEAMTAEKAMQLGWEKGAEGGWAKTGKDALNFGESAGAVEPFKHNGSMLMSMEIDKTELESFRKSNILADPNADPALKERILKEGGQPASEFLIPAEKHAAMTEHFGDNGLGTKEMQAEAAKGGLGIGEGDVKAGRIGNALKQDIQPPQLLDRIGMTMSRGDDGVTHQLAGGSINYDKVGPANVKQLLSDVTTVMRESGNTKFLDPGVQTHETVKEAARLMGKDPGQLLVDLKATRGATQEMAVQVTAGMSLMKRMATDLYTVSEKLTTTLASDTDRALFVHMADVLRTTMDDTFAIKTAAARTTSAGRIEATMGGMTKDTLAKILKDAGGPEWIDQLADRIKMGGLDGVFKNLPVEKTMFRKIVDAANFAWMNGILGGVKTHIVNILSTGGNAGLMPGYRMVGGLMQEIGAGIGFGTKGAGYEEMMKGYYQYSMLKSVVQDSLAMAKRAWETAGPRLLNDANPLEAKNAVNPISNEAFGVKAGFDTFGKMVALSSRALSTEDEFFKQILYRSHIGADATVSGLKQGLDGAALKAHIQKHIDASIVQAGQEVEGAVHAGKNVGQAVDPKSAAATAAKQGTWTQSLATKSDWSERSMMDSINNGVGQHPFVKGLVMPFIKVPTNLFRQAIDMTPGLNLLHKQWRADVAAGGEAGAHALGMMGIGTSLWTAAGFAAYEGRITGGGPTDPELRKQLGADWQPYSFRIWDSAAGKHQYISYARFDPFSHFFAVAADFTEVAGKVNPGDEHGIAGRATMAIMQNLASKSYLRSLNDVIGVVTQENEDKAAYWLRNRLASYVPGILGVLQTDDEVKNMRGVLDGVRARIPGWSASVEAQRDNFGAKVSAPVGYANKQWNPFTYFQGTDDPVRLEMTRLANSDSHARFPLPKPTFGGDRENQVDLRNTKNASGQSAYDRLVELNGVVEIGGKTLHQSLEAMMQTDSYKKAADKMGDGSGLYRSSRAVEMIQDKISLYQTKAERQMQKEFPQIREAKKKFDQGVATSYARGTSGAKTIEQLREIAGAEKF